VDVSKLLDQTGGDRALVGEIIDMYIEDRPKILEDLERALGKGDAATLELEAHRLRSTLATLAADRAADLARGLEQMGREGDLSGADGVFEALREEIGRAEVALLEFRRQGSEDRRER
jgi:HPt (histidine-containing phosphotransfer) domain-containing protein